MDCQNASTAEPHPQTIPTIVSGPDIITDAAADAIADLLLDRWFAQRTGPLRDAEPSEPQTRSTESAS